MQINKANLPYFYEDTSIWEKLPNGIERQITWEYGVAQSATTEIEDETYPLIIERLSCKQRYRCHNYLITASAVDEWQYLEKDDEPYSGTVLGYRGYWAGEITKSGDAVLQPEVAIMLGFTPKLDTIPPYIALISENALTNLLTEAEKIYSPDTAINAHKPPPIAGPAQAPQGVIDALYRLRTKSGLLVTRGRTALIEMMMRKTGVTIVSGGWRLTPTEAERRQNMVAGHNGE